MKNWGRCVIFIALICALMLIFSGSASATDLNTTPLSNHSNIYVNVSNDEGVSFNTTGNGTYYIQSLSSPNGGFNAVHIANDSSYTLNYGGSTNTTNQSGTFYITDTGGRGYQDNAILLLAVNGTIPDNFVIHLTVTGYYWTPTGVLNAAPVLSALHYGITLDETFTKSDFLYGTQNWKPTGGNENYPIFIGQDMNDNTTTFYLMFIDLHAGILGSNYPGGDSQFINNGAVQVNYSFENLQSLASFNVYAWNWNTSQGQGMLWTNSILPGNTGGPSGYTVMGTPVPSASFTSSPNSETNPLSVKFTDKSTGGAPLTYAWDFDGDGKTDSTEQNPVWTYSSSGTYLVTLTVTNEHGSDQITKNITFNSILASSNVSGDLYNATLAVNLTSPDKDAQIYYTLDGSTPTTSSTHYTGPINITSEGATTLKFIAVDGDLRSAVQTEVYTLDLTAPTVTVNPAGWIYNTVQNVTLTTTTDNSNTTTYYTTDGTDPKSSNTRTVYSKPISIYTNTTLKYAAVDPAGNWSPVYVENYNMVDITAPVTSADLPSGSYTTDQDVDLSAVDEMDPDPKIYYTLNGTTPTVNSTPYYLPIPINIVGTTVLRFIAADAAGHISDVITRVYFLDKASVSGTWNTTLIDKTNIEYNSIVMDSNGYPHIVYYQNAVSGGDPQLKYAYEDKNGWHIETVETSGSGSGAYVSFVLDSKGNPHLAYEDIFGGATPYMLKYAYRDSTGVWHISTLTTSYTGNTRGDQIEGINLVLYNDQPRISFYNDTGGKIEYMYLNGTSWVTETVATNGGPYDSLVLDSAGNPYISYYCISQSGYSSLRYAQRTADSTWQISIVDNSAYYVGNWNSLALNSAGNPCISYIWNNTCLKYTYWNGTRWITETVSSLQSSASKLVLDKSDSPLIVYLDALSYNLKYAYKEGSNWIISNIDSVNGAFGSISLALNSAGVPNVSYESTDSNLRYAYLVPFIVNASLVGDTYNTTKMVNLTSTHGTTVYYTKDGSDPRTSSTRIKYTASIMVNSTMTLKFAAEDSADNWSPICTETYIIIDNIAPTASASVPSGSYNAAKSVTLSMSEIGNIYYTTNGSTPTTASKKYTGPISITSTTTLKFLAVDGVGNKSPVYTVSYMIDKTAPTITSTNPKNKATNVAVNKAVQVTFSEPIKSGTLWVELKTSSGKTVSISKSISGNVLTITPKSNLSQWTTYTLLVHSGSVTDLAGNKYVYAGCTTFKTVDTTAPKVTAICPKNKARGVSRTRTVSIRLSENVLKSVNWSKIYIKNLKTGKKCRATIWISGNHIYIKTSKKASYTWYRVYIPAYAIKDKSGNKLAKSYTWIFKTGRY